MQNYSVILMQKYQFYCFGSSLDNSNVVKTFSRTFVPANINTNLTENNFVGFSDAAYSDGATAKIQIAGSVDDAQSGLTTAKKHYVQRDGSLGITTARSK